MEIYKSKETMKWERRSKMMESLRPVVGILSIVTMIATIMYIF